MEEKEDKENKPDEGNDRQRVPPLQRWSSAMDDIIDQAISEGLFDNLPGKGKPLKLSSNPFSADMELAHQLLKDNDYTLPWISARAAVKQAIADFRARVKEERSRYQAEFTTSESETVRTTLKQEWRRMINRWAQEIGELNKDIAEANLKQPGPQLEILKLNLDSELIRSGAKRELE